MVRVAIIGSPDKPAARSAMDRVQRYLEQQATAKVIFAELTYESARVLPLDPELIIVLGGDGTLISVVHGLGARQRPILAINLGKLGYLAEFTVAQLEDEGEFLFRNGIPVRRRLLLEVTLERDGAPPLTSPAVNDCVILAGTPFRMIELGIESDGDQVAELRGDGLVVATPSGSTAHNLSAGGPILEPTAEVYILTPICPHALTYRPVVMDAQRMVQVHLQTVNEGTTVSIDGQRNWPLRGGDCLRIRRYSADFQLVRNPGYSVWWAMRRKLMWGAGPAPNEANS